MVARAPLASTMAEEVEDKEDDAVGGVDMEEVADMTSQTHD